MRTNKIKTLVKYLFLVGLLAVPLLGHLNDQPIRIWDEARLAESAYEMNKTGNWLILEVDGKPDMWSTKPPFMVWCQVICMKLLGANELAVRLPSAVAAFLTCLLLLAFSVRYLKNFWFGFITVIVLITTQGYVGWHVTRTGDFDSMLVFFNTLFCISYYLLLETGNLKYLYIAFTALMFAALTKGIAAFLFLPGLFIYTLIQKKLKWLLVNRHFYFGCLIVIIPVVTYYLLREHYNPGYIQAVSENELGGRFLNKPSPEQARFLYYYDYIMRVHFKEWILILPFGIVIGFLYKNNKISKLTLFATVITLCFSLVISLSQTKCYWYDAPMFPFMAILVAIGISLMTDWIRENNFLKNTLRSNSIVALLFIFLVSAGPYAKTFEQTCTEEELPWDKEFFAVGYMLKEAVAGRGDFNNCTFLSYGYNVQNLFYINLLKDKGQRIEIKYFKTELSIGEKIIIPYQEVNDYVDKRYFLTRLGNYEHVLICRIDGKKNTN